MGALTLLAAVTAPDGLAPSVAASPSPGRVTCSGRPPVVVLHDLASGTSSVRQLAAALRGDGRCVRVLGYGTPRLLASAGLDTIAVAGGLEAIDREVRQLAPRIRRAAGRAAGVDVVDVVGVGVGSLVAVRYQQLTPHPVRVRRLVAVGALWRGTDLAGLGALEQASRDVGTYSTVLPIEQLVLDGVCASCREALRGSDLIRALHAAGIRRPGTRIVSVISRTDLFVRPFTSGRLPGGRTVVLQRVAPRNTTSHFGLPSDPTVIRIVRRVLE